MLLVLVTLLEKTTSILTTLLLKWVHYDKKILEITPIALEPETQNLTLLFDNRL